MKGLNVLEHLRCPRCQAEFSHSVRRQTAGAITDGKMRCENGHDFPIVDAVPRFVCDDLLDSQQLQTREVFSTQWNQFGEVTIDEQAFSISRQWMFDRYGWGDDAGVQDFLKDKRLILDAGSASGRYANYFAQISGNTVFGAEIGQGVDIAQAHFGANDNLHFVQASITHLPFALGIFDFILCDGVLHHTTHPRETFHQLVQYLKPGGQIAWYVYHVGNPLREMTDDIFIRALAREDMDTILAISKTMTELAQEFAESGATVNVPTRLEKLDINPGQYSLFELIFWKVIKLHWDPAVGFDKNWSTNFGWFGPANAFRFNDQEVMSWAKECELSILHSDISQRGISIRAQKC